jgi:micrococcal nuclease
MKYKIKKYILLILILSPCLASAIKISRVIDGDTFELENGEKVRMIGINAPEATDIFGEESENHLKKILSIGDISLVPDNLSKDRDRYGRLLRYVYLDTIDVNKKMIREGFAFAYLKYKFEKSAEYEKSQILAQSANFGIWGDSQNNEIISEQTESSSENNSFNVKQIMLLVGIVLLIGLGLKVTFQK